MLVASTVNGVLPPVSAISLSHYSGPQERTRRQTMAICDGSGTYILPLKRFIYSESSYIHPTTPKSVLFAMVTWVVGAAFLGFGLQNSTHNIRLMLPHGLQLLSWVFLEGRAAQQSVRM